MKKVRLTFERTAENVQALAREVLKYMPEGWTSDASDATYYFNLKPPTGKYSIGVSLREAPNKYNANIEFDTPNNISYSEINIEDVPKTSTDFQRGPEPIAQAIIKKLLPFAQEKDPIIQANVQKIYETRAARYETCEGLAALCNTHLSSNGSRDDLSVDGNYSIRKLRPNSDGSRAVVEFTFNSLPIEQVKKLIVFMRDNKFDK